MRKNWNFGALLLGMKNGAAPVENSMVTDKKLSIKLPYGSSNSSSGYMTPGIVSRGSNRYHTPMFTATIHCSQQVKVTRVYGEV